MLGYKKLIDKLGKPGVTDRASRDILDLIIQWFLWLIFLEDYY